MVITKICVEQEKTIDFGYFLQEREEVELASAALKLDAISSNFIDDECLSSQTLLTRTVIEV